MDLYASLLDKLRSRKCHFSLVHLYIETYRGLDDDDEETLRHQSILRQFLFTATKHNHVDLVKELLSNEQYDTLLGCVIVPLSIAISSGNIPLVQVFLNSRPSLNLLAEPQNGPILSGVKKIKDMYETRGIDTEERMRNGELSVFDCACLCDQRDILKLFIAYDCRQKRCSGVYIADGASTGCRNGLLCHAYDDSYTALHAVVRLVRNDCFRRMLTLPAIIHIILDAGVNVHVLRGKKFTALLILIDEVYFLSMRGEDITTEECDMIIDTARILLEAGSVTVSSEYNSCLTAFLVRTLDISLEFLTSSASTIVCRNIYKMMSQFIQLLISHGALGEHAHKEVPFDGLLLQIACCLIKYTQRFDAAPVNAEAMTKYNTVMEHISDIINFFLLADGDIMNYSVISDDQVIGLPSSYKFMSIFMLAAGHSFERGHSKKLIRLLLNSLSPSQVNQLKMRLVKNPVIFLELDLKYTHRALEWVSSVEVPFSLLHLSRRAITRAMSHRCLDAQKVSTLGLPKHISKYLGYYYMNIKREDPFETILFKY